MLGDPHRTGDPQPGRMPVFERLHAATDPQGVTSWGKVAAKRMRLRGHVMSVQRELLPPGVPYPWKQLGLPYQSPDHQQAAQPFLAQWARKVRMLSLITSHGALDLEIPDLLLHLFPRWFDVRFLLGGTGTNRLKICEKTEGSTIMDNLCRVERLQSCTEKAASETPPASTREFWVPSKMGHTAGQHGRCSRVTAAFVRGPRHLSSTRPASAFLG